MNTLRFLLQYLLHGRLGALEWLATHFGETSPLRIGNRRAMLLNNAALIEEVLVQRVDEFQKGPALRVHSRPLLGDGLLTSEGAEHRSRRKLVAPAFAHQRVPKYAGVMAQLSQDIVKSWHPNGVLDMHREMTRLTLAIVGRTLFDADLLDDADSIGKLITGLIEFATDQTRSFHPIPIDSNQPRAREARAAVEQLDRTIYSLIESRRPSGDDRGDLLSTLLLARDEDGHALTNQQVRDEAMTLFVAGHETTANATAWSFYLLAQHPEIQRDLQREVRQILGDRLVTVADLPCLPLSLRVFKEALRLYPPAYIVVREPLQDTTLNGGIPVHKGELLAMCEWTIHRSPRYFPDPLRFDPSRFTAENEATIPRYAYFPFGAGRRICIGNQFALMEGQIILSTVVQHCTLALANRRSWHGNPLMTLRPKGAAPLRVVKR